MGFFLYIVFFVIISTIIIYFSKYIVPFFKIFLLILTVLFLIKIFPIIGHSLYKVNNDIVYIRVFDTPTYGLDYTNYEKNKIKYVLINVNHDFYKIYAYANGFFSGYVPKVDGAHKLGLYDELQIKLLLSLPIFFLLLIIFIEDDFFIEWKRMRKKWEQVKDKLYVDSAIISEMKQLRIELEEMRTRRSKLEKMEDKLIKLKEMTVNEEILNEINALNKDIDKLKFESGYKIPFEEKLAKTNNFIEQCILYLDYEKYKQAIDVFMNNIQKLLEQKADIKDLDYHDLVNYAYTNKIIDFEIKQNLFWISNLDRDIKTNTNAMFVNLAKMRQLFDDINKKFFINE